MAIYSTCVVDGTLPVKKCVLPLLICPTISYKKTQQRTHSLLADEYGNLQVRDGLSAQSALLAGKMVVRSQVSNWRFNKQHDRPEMACQVVINKFVFDDFFVGDALYETDL